MKYLLKIFICTSLFLCATSSKAQVTAVQFALVHNPLTKLFDCFLYIEEGNASTMKERVQFNAQISLIVPTSSDVVIEKTYMPLIDNQTFKGNQPIKWTITSKLVSPQIAPGIDLYGITPSLAPAGFYNRLLEGEVVKLFSLNVTGDNLDKSKVRIFDNEMDPKSYELGMQNGDFSNGFTIGGYYQTYKGNKNLGLAEILSVDKRNKNK